MIVKKYRSVPVTIEAMQLEPETDNWKDVCDWVSISSDYNVEIAHVGDGVLVIETLEGPMTARPGDYVIKGLIGEFYPCKSEVFEQKYVLDLSERIVG